MNALAWGLQIFLAIAFLLHGLIYTVAWGTMSRRMQERGQSGPPLQPAFRQFIGVAEIAAAFGLIVPPAIHVLPWLAPLAAAGLVVVMAGAVVRHAQRRESQMVAVVAVLGALAAVTVVLRWLVVPL
jgi:DoxX-like family